MCSPIPYCQKIRSSTRDKTEELTHIMCAYQVLKKQKVPPKTCSHAVKPPFGGGATAASRCFTFSGVSIPVMLGGDVEIPSLLCSRGSLFGSERIPIAACRGYQLGEKTDRKMSGHYPIYAKIVFSGLIRFLWDLKRKSGVNMEPRFDREIAAYTYGNPWLRSKKKFMRP